MTGMIFAGLVVLIVAYFLVKGYTPQAMLFIGGLLLLGCTALLGMPVLTGKTATNSIFFDIFKTFSNIFSSRAGGLGLQLMAIGGFSRYMDHVGASKALFTVFERPLKSIKSPYILLGVSFAVMQVLAVFIPSNAGLALLMMVTMYPILIRTGVNQLSALGMIACAQFMDVGPGSGNAILAAQIAEISVVDYFVKYQLVVFVPITLALAVVHPLVQRWWDKREGWVFDATKVAQITHDDESMPPRFYAILPVLPLFFLLGFSSLMGSKIKMDVVTAMVLSTVVSIVCEYFRTRDFKATAKSFMLFFEGMGKILASVVSLIVCGEFFAAGLTQIGAVRGLLDAAQAAGFGLGTMALVGGLILSAASFIMGSGNAAFFSFAPVVKELAIGLGVPTIKLIFPLQIMLSFGREASPITAGTVAIAGLAGVSPFQVAKRAAIPMVFASIMNMVMYYLIFYNA